MPPHYFPILLQLSHCHVVLYRPAPPCCNEALCQVQWSYTPLAVGHSFPYVIALLKKTIEVWLGLHLG